MRDSTYRVLTDNGSAYKSKVFNAAVAATRTRHKYTRPCRSQTNGKIERFHRTLARESAYHRPWDSITQRTEQLPMFMHRYNYHRPHTALKGLAPVERTTTVTNLSGSNI